ncbi:hypothetical protein OH76DRAFT_1489488, partial [Lentinus brumalis]
MTTSFQGFTERISQAAGYNPADTPTRRGKLPAVSTTPPSPGGTHPPSPAIIQPVFPITSPNNPFDQSAMRFYSPAQGSASQARAAHAGAQPNPVPQAGTSGQAQAAGPPRGAQTSGTQATQASAGVNPQSQTNQDLAAAITLLAQTAQSLQRAPPPPPAPPKPTAFERNNVRDPD